MLQDMIRVGPPQPALQNHPKIGSVIKKIENKVPLMKHKSETKEVPLLKQESEGKDFKISGGVPMPVGDNEEMQEEKVKV